MINWFNMPDEGLSNGGLFEVKELEVTENGTYETKGEMYNKVTVNVEGGGSSWQTVFEGSVTTESEGNFASGDIVGLESLNGDSVKVTFNGAEYTLPKHELGYGEMGYGNVPDFTNYPVFIETTDTPCLLYTETAGTYTLKIEEPQSGGSSDFSTALVTVSPDDGYVELNGFVPVILDDEGEFITCVDSLENGYNVVLYNGSLVLVTTTEPTYTVSGNASLETLEPIMPMEPTRYKLTITGDCTITIS